MCESARFNRLLIIVSDALSVLVRKGEITPRYYNPGELFQEVHIIRTNNDDVDAAALQTTVGNAKLHLHSLPLKPHSFLRTIAYRPWLLNKWADQGMRLVNEIKPDLVRCYGNSFNGFMGARIKAKSGIPLVVSLHHNPDKDFRGTATSIRQRIITRAHIAVEQPALRLADYFIAVYDSICPYLREHHVRNYGVIYGAVGHATPKDSYDLRAPASLLCVGLQLNRLKDPRHIIEAVAELPETELTLIGQGDLHEELKELARKLKCNSRCKFIQNMPNDEVLKMMHNSDVYLFNQIMLGISKTVIEASLTGLPIIVNTRPRDQQDELGGDWLLQAEDSKNGYLTCLRQLLEDKQKRISLGERALANARQKWSPEEMEARTVEIYRGLASRIST